MKKLLLFSISLLFSCFVLQSSRNEYRKIRALQEAILAADLGTVNRLIEENVNIDFADTNGTTVLHYASQVGSPDVLKALIGAGALCEVKNINGATPLHHAAAAGRLECIKYLIDSGVNKEASDNTGATPLHHAAGLGRLDVVKYLVGSGANKESQNNNGSTPLHHSAGAGHVDVVSFLVGLNVNKDSASNSRLTPLHHAALSDRADVITFLVEHGANKEARNINKRTPFALAVISDKFKSVKALIACGANKRLRAGVHYSERMGNLLNWYKPEIIEEEKTLFGQAVAKSLDAFYKGHPGLLAKVLGGSILNDESMFPAATIKRARALFEPNDLENNIIPELRKQLPELTIEGNEEIAMRARDYLKSIKTRPRSDDYIEIEDK